MPPKKNHAHFKDEKNNFVLQKIPPPLQKLIVCVWLMYLMGTVSFTRLSRPNKKSTSRICFPTNNHIDTSASAWHQQSHSDTQPFIRESVVGLNSVRHDQLINRIRRAITELYEISGGVGRKKAKLYFCLNVSQIAWVSWVRAFKHFQGDRRTFANIEPTWRHDPTIKLQHNICDTQQKQHLRSCH